MRSLPRTGRRRRRLRRLLGQIVVHRAAVLSAARDSLCLRSRSRAVVDGSDRRSAGYARARAAVRYDDVARTLVHALKYQDRTDLAPAMGRWMARAGMNCSATLTRWFRCRCIGDAAGAAATISPGRWRASSNGKPA